MAPGKRLHIVMFPWLAFGHLLPFLHLAMLIAKRGHKISFISTPRNIERLPKVPSDLKPLIDFIRVPLPPLGNLPYQAEATSDVPFDKVKFLKISFDYLEHAVTVFIESMLPDWILCDFASYWLGPIASRVGIPVGWYSIYPASILGFFGPPENMIGDDNRGDNYRAKLEDFTSKPEWVRFETSVAMTKYQIQATAPNLEDDETANVTDQVRLGLTIKNCDLVAIRSSFEFEPEWLNLVEEIYGKPVVPVGLLPVEERSTNFGGNDCWGDIKDWLDKQAQGSVIYVAFGAETKLNQVQVAELALGLELSGLPFFWAFRKQRGLIDPEPVELPQGFEERTRDRGMVYKTWVPQNNILKHGSVGGMLFHAGWSSVVEAMQFGKVLVLLPMLGDQGIIASQLEEKKLGVLIPRNEQDGRFTKDSVVESLNLVMVDEAGKIYRDNVKEMQSVFADTEKQDGYVDNLVAYLKANKRQSSMMDYYYY
ncbi:Anthocyanidine rhamnosyl-transferase [Heracleum sosnowskyi]|uniref:Anthocyanidine rhamnosyl-transferase n=1 Tax=Heracleum sosnowskyi TaxID=360622 RepID=A0AAD8MW84_9APIA|nr:Anthocyanidine rhamnosyl-transferase [Heracleum sosnowskyi]